MKYLVIGYNGDYDDYCMGCHMASYPSDFVLEEDLTEEEMIALVAELEATEGRCPGDCSSYDEIRVFSGARDAFAVDENAPAAEVALEEERVTRIGEAIKKKKNGGK